MPALPTLQVLFHHPGPAWRAGVSFREQPGVEQHMAFMAGLDADGRMVLGGPFLDEVGDGQPVGMAVVSFDSLAEADARAQADTSVAAGLIVAVTRPWLVPMGSASPEPR